MSRAVFFNRERGLSIDDIVELTGARSRRKPAAGFLVLDVAAIDRAGPGDITFVETSEDETVLRASQAGACFVRGELVDALPPRVLALETPDPFRAFVLVATALYPHASRPSSLFETRTVAKTALVHPTARLEAEVIIDPGAVIGPRAEVGTGTIIGPMAVIGPDVCIGRDCSIGAGGSLTNALLGDRVIVHAGSRIGQDGQSRTTGAGPGATSPQLGRVILQDNVEVGANCAIDRGGYGDTVIGEGTKIDNLVQIASDSMVGRYCRIVATEVTYLAETGVSRGKPATSEAACADGIQLSASAVGRRVASHMNRANE
jgi:UDP-3-O-[3-hydroxymyristoyl] glucosamine N-acyltransferase